MAPKALHLDFDSLKPTFNFYGTPKAKESPRVTPKLNVPTPRSWAFQAQKTWLGAFFLAFISLIFISKSFKGTLAHNSRAIYLRPTFFGLESSNSASQHDACTEHVQQLKPAPFYPIEVLPQTQDACSRATSIPTIALMFLTRGNLFHQALWREWFLSAKGVLPKEIICAQKKRDSIVAACLDIKSDNLLSDKDIISMQYLFNIYIHAPPSVTGE